MSCTVQALSMCDLESYIGSAPESPTIESSVAVVVDFLRGMVRKHRFVCIGWKRMADVLNGFYLDSVTEQTFKIYGIRKALDWNELLHKESVYCAGADKYGIYFGGQNVNRRDDDISFWFENLVYEGPDGIAEHLQRTELNFAGALVHYISIPGAPRPPVLVSMRGK